MCKKILIWSRKGGVGKTNISAQLAFMLDFPVITNDMISPLFNLFPNKAFISENGALPKLYPKGIIYDFGGFSDNRIPEIASKSSIVIVPTLPEYSDLLGCLKTLQELKKYSHNIIVIANRVRKPEQLEYVKKTVSKEIGKDVKVFPINDSRGLPNIYHYQKSIGEIAKIQAFGLRNYSKILGQFKTLSNEINRGELTC